MPIFPKPYTGAKEVRRRSDDKIEQHFTPKAALVV
jgi:hypothetical protein